MGKIERIHDMERQFVELLSEVHDLKQSIIDLRTEVRWGKFTESSKMLGANGSMPGTAAIYDPSDFRHPSFMFKGPDGGI